MDKKARILLTRISLFLVLSITPIVFHEAVAGAPSTRCDSIQSGLWTDPNTWNCDGFDVVPNSSIDAYINPGHTVTVSDDVSAAGVIVFGGPTLGTLIINEGASLTADFINNEGDTFNFGILNVGRFYNSVFDTFHNQCTGVVNIIGDHDASGFNSFGFLIINHGIFNINNGDFINQGIFQNSGTINGNFVNVDKGVLESIPSICNIIGGELIPIDTTALLLAEVQSTTWLIPVVLSVLGIGLFVVSRKSENS